jgi:hypothetical protein
MWHWLLCCSKRKHTSWRHKTGDHMCTIPSARNGNSPVSCCNSSTIRTCLVARITTDSSNPDLCKQLALTAVLYLQVRTALRAYHTPSSEIMTTSTKYKSGFGLTYFELWSRNIVQGHHVVQKKKKCMNPKLKACPRQTSNSITLGSLFILQVFESR